MVLCTHPPVCVLFQREVVKHQPFQAIQNDCIPVFASAFPVRVENMWIKRLQVPMSPAFALTEYKVQGSTYRTAVLDLSRHSNARGEDAVHARHCSIYVQLSRLKTMSGYSNRSGSVTCSTECTMSSPPRTVGCNVWRPQRFGRRLRPSLRLPDRATLLPRSSDLFLLRALPSLLLPRRHLPSYPS